MQLPVFMWFPNNLGLPTVPPKNVEEAITPSGLMDETIDGLTDDYIGSADKISVILCTGEMKQSEGRDRGSSSERASS